MDYNDYCKQFYLREDLQLYKDLIIAARVLNKFFIKTSGVQMSLLKLKEPLGNLFMEYAANKGTKNEEVFNELLKDNGFNWQFSIHSAIYDLLTLEEDSLEGRTPLDWPGINNIEGNNNHYTLNTVLGDIEVYKASEIFKNTKHYHIFKKELAKNCYFRTYDFLSESDEYKAVLSHQPSAFHNGHYHSYLENDEAVLDIATNALYYSKESAAKVLTGEKLATLSYEQVNQEFASLKDSLPEECEENKLLTLTLYHDMHR